MGVRVNDIQDHTQLFWRACRIARHAPTPPDTAPSCRWAWRAGSGPSSPPRHGRAAGWRPMTHLGRIDLFDRELRSRVVEPVMPLR